MIVKKDHRLPRFDDGLQFLRIVPNAVPGGIESRIVQLTVINQEILLPVGVVSEVIPQRFCPPRLSRVAPTSTTSFTFSRTLSYVGVSQCWYLAYACKYSL